MNRNFWILLLLGLSLAVTIVACDSDTIIVEPPSQVVRGIQVTGSGSTFGKPDVALLNLGISVEKASVKEASSEAAAAMQKVLDSLKDNGVAEKDIQTRHFSIQPQFDYIDKRKALRGYLVTNIVSAKVRDIDNVGEVIDDATNAGGDLLRVQSITFTIDDPKELQDQARIKAMKDAHAKAQTLAEQENVKLGKPISISEVVGLPIRPQFEEARPMTTTPIEPGQLKVTVTVTVVYAIE